jgi:hypothetical protein
MPPKMEAIFRGRPLACVNMAEPTSNEKSSSQPYITPSVYIQRLRVSLILTSLSATHCSLPLATSLLSLSHRRWCRGLARARWRKAATLRRWDPVAEVRGGGSLARWCGRAAHTALCSATLAVGSTTRKVAAAAARAWRWAPQRAQRVFHFFVVFSNLFSQAGICTRLY